MAATGLQQQLGAWKDFHNLDVRNIVCEHNQHKIFDAKALTKNMHVF